MFPSWKTLTQVKKNWHDRRLSQLLLGFGILVRAVQYLSNRSLWADEAVLALNIVNRSYVELLQPLDYDQAAPIGFLTIEKFSVQLFGNTEYALRLFPFLCAIASLFGFYQLAKTCLERQAVPLAMSLFVSLEYLVYYASEVKQYSTDVAVAVGLSWMMLSRLQKNSSALPIFLYGMIGAIAIWFSHPAVFVLASLGTIALIQAIRSRSRQAIVSAIGVSLIWFLSFLAFYVTSLSAIGNNSTLVDSWGKGFMPSLWALDWLFDRLFKFFDRPLGFPDNWIGDLAFVVCAIGGYSLWKRHRQSLYVVLFPLLFTLLASYLKKYPFRDRLLIFLAPFFILAIAQGAIYLWQKTCKTRWRVLTAIAIAALLIPSLTSSAALVIQPQKREEIKPTIAYVKQHQKPGDILYIFQRGEYQFKYYAPKFGYTEGSYIIGVDDLDDGEKVSPEEWTRYKKDFDRLRGKSRVWMLFSHTSGAKEEEERVLSYLDEIGKKIESFERPGAFVYLYDFR